VLEMALAPAWRAAALVLASVMVSVVVSGSV
jgi:hypothetical protein